jgi:hypothetical protein
LNILDCGGLLCLFYVWTARSLVAWRSKDGYDWSFQGIITDAKDYVPQDTGIGNSEENDMAIMADVRAYATL